MSYPLLPFYPHDMLPAENGSSYEKKRGLPAPEQMRCENADSLCR
jgi:hypothetical protein